MDLIYSYSSVLDTTTDKHFWLEPILIKEVVLSKKHDNGSVLSGGSKQSRALDKILPISVVGWMVKRINKERRNKL